VISGQGPFFFGQTLSLTNACEPHLIYGCPPPGDPPHSQSTFIDLGIAVEVRDEIWLPHLPGISSYRLTCGLMRRTRDSYQ